MSASAIYAGTVRHRRVGERDREFRHLLRLLYLDLGELPDLLGGRLIRKRPGLVRVRRRDLLGDPGVPLADAVRARVAEHTGRPAPAGAIRVLTMPRTLGHCFNPVSFYYLFDEADHLAAMVAEVTNTPWGERHAYILPRDGEPGVLQGTFAKELHVSPFMGMDHRYVWQAGTPGPSLSVHIESVRDGERAFDATLALERRPLTRRTLAATTARQPAASMRVLALIYGHALALKLAGARVHPHPHHQAS